MRFEVITLFPEMFDGVFDKSIIKRAQEKKLIEIKYHQMRQWSWNNYGSVDDKPYGGDIGMLIRVDVIDKAIKEITEKSKVESLKPKLSMLDAAVEILKDASRPMSSKELIAEMEEKLQESLGTRVHIEKKENGVAVLLVAGDDSFVGVGRSAGHQAPLIQ